MCVFVSKYWQGWAEGIFCIKKSKSIALEVKITPKAAQGNIITDDKKS